MNRWLVMFLLIATVDAQASDTQPLNADMGALCTDTWYHSIEAKVPTGDGHGHGPDIGSDEWKSVIEFQLGIRDQPNLPPRHSDAWCRHINQLVLTRRTSSDGDGDSDEVAMSQGPSFACDKVEAGSIEAMICEDNELSALDRTLADVYAAATEKASNEYPPQLKAEQRGWIKGRNACWKDEDTRGCVRDEYTRRIAELQARYRLLPGEGPVRFICDGNPANEVIATFFQTEPPTLVAEHGDSVSLMYLQPSASGTKYQGRNETLWAHQGEALITWGYDAPSMRCTKAP